MIVDRLSNSHLYDALGPRIKQALDYLRQTDLAAIEPGKYPLDGHDVYASVQQYTTKPKDEGRWEAHRRYIDVQYVVNGAEQIGYAHLSRLTAGEYDADKDLLRLTGHGDLVSMPSGTFMLLLPEDAHMPGLAVDAPSPVKKIVVKIAVE